MPTNQFYYLLTHNHNPENIFCEDAYVKPNRHSKQLENFVVIEFPRKAPYRLKIANIFYVIEENHISIYEKTCATKKNSIYHCTFVLRNEITGEQYKLHVYFNDKDQCVHMQLKTTMPNKKNIIHLSETDKKWLVELTKQRCSLYMVHLRQVRHETIATFENKLDAITRKIADEYLTNPIEDNLQTCLDTIINPALREADHLTSYSGDSTSKSVLLCYQRGVEFKIAELQRSALQETTASPTEGSPQSPLTRAASPVSAHSSQTPDQSARAIAAAEFDALHIKLAESVEELKKIQASDPYEPDQLVEYHKKAEDTLILLLSCPIGFKQISEHVNVIDVALHESRNKGLVALNEAIILGRWDKAEKLLSCFGKDLPDQVIASIIVSDNADILERLIEQDASLVSRCHIRRQNGHFCSLLEFAFVKESENCFKKLLAHGASTLEPVQDANLQRDYAVGPIESFPLAHIIFQQPHDNPFRLALGIHYANSQFIELSVLNLTLQAHLEQLDESTSFEVKTKLESFIKANTTAINRHKITRGASTGGITTLFQRKLIPVLTEISTHTTLSQATQEDPELQRKIEERDELMQKLFSKITLKEKIGILKNSKTFIELLNNYVKAEGAIDTRRSALNEALDNELKQLRLQIRYCDIKQQLTSGHGHISWRAQGKLANEGAQIEKDIRAHLKTQNAITRQMEEHIQRPTQEVTFSKETWEILRRVAELSRRNAPPAASSSGANEPLEDEKKEAGDSVQPGM